MQFLRGYYRMIDGQIEKAEYILVLKLKVPVGCDEDGEEV